MWIPSDQVRILARLNVGGPFREDGTIDWRIVGQDSYTHIPGLFVEWDVLDNRELDEKWLFGYYWPIGKEETPPIAVTGNEVALHPIASGLEACLLLMHAIGNYSEELPDLLHEFGLTERAATISHRPAIDGGIQLWGVPSAEDLLPIDLESPHLLLQAAKEQAAIGELDRSLSLVEAALAHLPEYADALWFRVQVLRRLRRVPESANAMLNYLTTPMLFYGFEHWRTAIKQIKQLPDETLPDCQDPFWTRRSALTLAEGVKTNPDYLLYDEMIEEYHKLGLGIKAVSMRIRVCEMMRSETVSFQERYGWSSEAHEERMRNDLMRAGLTARLEAFA